MKTKNKDNFDLILSEFKLEASVPEESDTESYSRRNITLWIPKNYRAKYDLIQEQSKKRFSKCLKKMIMKAIDQVHPDPA